MTAVSFHAYAWLASRYLLLPHGASFGDGYGPVVVARRAVAREDIARRCYRRSFYDQGKFAKTFDDEGARSGWCLYELGCKGPIAHNACATIKWNAGTSFPIQSGHGCLGCSEPNFWDKGSFYKALSTAEWGDAKTLGAAVAVGVAAGAAAAYLGRKRQDRIEKEG